jgi:hypothetical protein
MKKYSLGVAIAFATITTCFAEVPLHGVVEKNTIEKEVSWSLLKKKTKKVFSRLKAQTTEVLEAKSKKEKKWKFSAVEVGIGATAGFDAFGSLTGSASPTFIMVFKKK